MKNLYDSHKLFESLLLEKKFYSTYYRWLIIITKLARIKKVILDHKILNNSFDIQCAFTKSWELWIHFLFLKNCHQNQCWSNSKKTQSEWIMKHLFTKIKPWFKATSTLISIATILVFMEELNFQSLGLWDALIKDVDAKTIKEDLKIITTMVNMGVDLVSVFSH